MRADTRGDLVVLVADKDAKIALETMFLRYQSLGICPVTSAVFVHRCHDPGCLRESPEFLRSYAATFHHALVIFDREGCGREDLSSDALEEDVTQRLSRSGWSDRAATIVVDPELDLWVWSDSPNVDRVLGWQGRTPDLRAWLRHKGYLAPDQTKPQRPKEALELALVEAQKPRSSSIYASLAHSVSLERCVDPAFLRLRATLQRWFRQT